MRRYRNVKCKKFPGGGGYTVEEYEALQSQIAEKDMESIDNAVIKYGIFSKPQYQYLVPWNIFTQEDLETFFEADKKTVKQDITLKFGLNGRGSSNIGDSLSFTVYAETTRQDGSDIQSIYCERANGIVNIHTVELDAGDMFELYINNTEKVTYTYYMAVAYAIMPK